MNRKDRVYIFLRSPLLETDLTDTEKVATLFGIQNDRIGKDARDAVVGDIAHLIEEIAIFYNE